MISVMLAISQVVMLSRMAQSSIKTLHKIGFGYSTYRHFFSNFSHEMVNIGVPICNAIVLIIR